MNGPMGMIGQNISLLDVLEVKPDTFKPEDVTALEQMGQQAAPEYEKENCGLCGRAVLRTPACAVTGRTEPLARARHPGRATHADFVSR